jgi:predicted  nucleic acid-binding Zn-ribbon protein
MYSTEKRIEKAEIAIYNLELKIDKISKQLAVRGNELQNTVDPKKINRYEKTIKSLTAKEGRLYASLEKKKNLLKQLQAKL